MTLPRSCREILEDTFELAEACPSREPRLKTGFPSFDECVGLMDEGTFIVVGARPGVGKTAFLLAVADHMSMREKRVLFFSLEHGAERLMERLLCLNAGVGLGEWARGRATEDEYARLVIAAGVIQESPLLIDDPFRPLLPSLGRKAAALHKAAPLDLILVDGMDRIRTEPGRATAGPCLKALAMALRVPVLASAPLLPLMGQPSVGGPRGYGFYDPALELEADVVALMRREEGRDDDEPPSGSRCEVTLVRNRTGPLKRLELTFRSDSLRFEAPGGAVLEATKRTT